MKSFNEKNLDQLDFLDDSNLEKRNNNENKLVESILILDTETTGLDENKDELVEVGCILFNVPSKSVLSQVSFLLPVNSNPAEFINGISHEISQCPQPWEDAITFFYKLVDFCDFIVAHNVEFDKKWFGKDKLPDLNKKWICSLEDINWSFKQNIKSRPSITDLALSFGIPVWNLHRALADCYYLSEVFKRCDNLNDILVQASKPKFLYKAMVSYEERFLAKDAGFRWNSPVQGAWTKKLSENEAIELDFEVEILKKTS